MLVRIPISQSGHVTVCTPFSLIGLQYFCSPDKWPIATTPDSQTLASAIKTTRLYFPCYVLAREHTTFTMSQALELLKCYKTLMMIELNLLTQANEKGGSASCCPLNFGTQKYMDSSPLSPTVSVVSQATALRSWESVWPTLNYWFLFHTPRFSQLAR